MTQEQIKKWIKQAHENAVEKGFYDCPTCGGSGSIHDAYNATRGCKACNGTGIDPDKNIGELLSDIVEELMDAKKAHRCGRFVPKDLDTSYGFNVISIEGIKTHYTKEWYEGYIKNTREDKIADVFIRIFDLFGYKKINIQDVMFTSNYIVPRGVYENIAEEFLNLSGALSHYAYAQCLDGESSDIAYILSRLESLCLKLNIPIEKHIEAKIAYNKTRPVKHGKEY